MSSNIKDKLKVVKEELSNDEKLLEQAFQLEKFFKKHKIKIYTITVLTLASIFGYQGYKYYQDYKLNTANEALLELYKNPDNKEALETLKENNPNLYNLYIYNRGASKESLEELEGLRNLDDILQDLVSYHKGVIKKEPQDSIYYKNLALVEKAYLLLKEGKKEEAKNILSTIDRDSPLAPIAELMMHYTIK